MQIFKFRNKYLNLGTNHHSTVQNSIPRYNTAYEVLLDLCRNDAQRMANELTQVCARKTTPMVRLKNYR
jgi:hypothetical protein